MAKTVQHQPSLRRKKEITPKVPYTDSFQIQQADLLQQQHGFSALSGGDAALLSGNKQLLGVKGAGNMDLNTNLGEDASAASEEQLGFTGKVDRFFSRNINFSVNGAVVQGKNTHQVRGGAIVLQSGLVLDLAPATLTGTIEGGIQKASGNGAMLYFAPSEAESLGGQAMESVTVDQSQTIKARGMDGMHLAFKGADVMLGAGVVEQHAANENKVTFAHMQLEKLGKLTISNAKSSQVQLEKGALRLDNLSFGAINRTIKLEKIEIVDGGLKFAKGFAKNEQGSADFSSGILAQTPFAKIINDNWVYTQTETSEVVKEQSTVLNKAPLAEQISEAEGSATAIVVEDTQTLSPQVVIPPSPPPIPETLSGGILKLSDVVKKMPDGQEYFANLSLDTTLNLTGIRGVTFGKVTGESRGETLSISQEGRVDGVFGDIELEIQEAAHKAYSVTLVDVSVEDGIVKFGIAEVEREKEGLKAGGSTDESGVAGLLNFDIPTFPERATFNNITQQGTALTGVFERDMKGVYTIEDLGGIFSATLDLEKNSLAIAVGKEEALSEKGIFSKNEWTIIEVPILPGLTFGLSFEPSANMSAKFEAEGTGDKEFFMPNGSGSLRLKGSGTFGVSLGMQLNADLEVGAGKFASVYAGLFANAEVSTTATLTSEIELKKENGKIQAQSLDFTGDLGAYLKGAVGLHGGVKILLWKGELFEYTLKDWDLAKLELALNVSKDMDLPFSKGWTIEKGSVDFEGMKKKFSVSHTRENKFRLKPIENTLVSAVKLEKDYQSIRKQLSQVAERYQMIENTLKQSGECTLAVDTEQLKLETDKLMEFGAVFAQKAKDTIIEDKALYAEFIKLVDEIEQRKIKNAEAINKHRDRLQYLTYVIDSITGSEPTQKSEYDDALSSGITPTLNRFTVQELNKSKFFSEMIKEERALMAKASQTNPKKQSDIVEHEDRIRRFEALQKESASKSSTEILQEIKAIGGESVLKRQEIAKKQASKRIRAITSGTRFIKTQHAPNDQSDWSANRLERHIAYEKKRLEYYDSSILEAQMIQVIERMAALEEIQKDCKEINKAFSNTMSIPKGVTKKSNPSSLVAALRPILEQGSNMGQTGAQTVYFEQSEQSRKTQQAYLLRVT